ncbi:MAG: peptidylprolyl isomerase [Oscillospiraceae bacterium]|nr:peptidylprolyl isomerase [Oscillospiraceae bacterium]
MSASTEKKNRIAAREAGTDKKTIAAQKEAEEKAKSRRKWTWGTIGVIVLILAILILNSGIMMTATTALTVNGVKYSPAEVNYYYGNQYLTMANQYGNYASAFGLDTSLGLAGLGDQECSWTDGGTWRDYFRESAKSDITQTRALLEYAAENGITLTEDEVAEVEAGFEGMEETAKEYGYRNADTLYSMNYGSGVTTEVVRQAALDSTLAGKAYNDKNDSFSWSDEELEEYYQGLNGDRDLFDYEVYFVSAETIEETTTDENGEETSTMVADEQTRETAKSTADAILTAYLAAVEEPAEETAEETVTEEATEEETAEEAEAEETVTEEATEEETAEDTEAEETVTEEAMEEETAEDTEAEETVTEEAMKEETAEDTGTDKEVTVEKPAVSFTESFAATVAAQTGEQPSERSDVSGSSLPAAYADWMKADRTAGDAAVFADAETDPSGYNVVVFVGRNDNHYTTRNVRHILINAEADEEGNFTDEAKAAAKARAEEILAEYEAGDRTEESFAALAEEYSGDGGSNTNGGLYENISRGQMVPEFDDFCFAEHETGDTGIVYGENGSYAGYHIMYYVGEGPLYSNYIAKSDLQSEAISSWLTEVTDAVEVTEGFGFRFVGK